MSKKSLAVPFQLTVIVLGSSVVALSAAQLSFTQLDVRFLLLALVTIGIGSRVTIKIPYDKGQISVSDTFIFLCVLLFGMEAAVLLAAAEALCSSLRFCRLKITILFNAAVMAFSTYLTVCVLRLAYGSVGELRGGYSAAYIIGISLLAFVQYIANSGMVAAGYALKSETPLWTTWRRHFFWTSISYFAGASAAGMIAKLIDAFGFYAFLATTPIIAIVYFTYAFYLKNVEASAAQARQAEEHVAALRESEERFRSAFDHAAGMALVSADGRWIQVNRSLCEMIGYDEEELLATTLHAVTHEDDIAALRAQVSRLLEGKLKNFQMELRYMHRQGRAVWALVSVTLVRNSKCESTELIFQTQDITDRKRAEERLMHDAFHDVLTGLPNRALFMDHLKLSVERAKRRDSRLFAVLFLDLDRFKIVNDSLGHMVGDQLLVGIARRLETCLRPGDTVARLGGDEFTILLEDLNDADEAIEVAGRLQKELSLPFNLGGHEVFTTVSIGIALSTTGYERAEEVLRDADTAMYRAKTQGKARHEVFDKAMHARALNLLQLETDLRRAVEREEFFLHYQPIVSLETGLIRGFEALVRWQHPERGHVSPIDFIPVAEETGLIIPIGEWVLAEACREVKRWQERFPSYPPLQISVNISGKQLMKSDLIEQVRRVLRETGIEPRALKLEITESIMMENIESAIALLNHLRALGVELSIDDFGTGYSSLSYLHRFPVSTLKIDRSFVGRMDGNNENAEIVRTIVMLARNLDMDVIAEGVETEHQVTQLRALRCEYGQGYHFSKPVDAAGAAALLANNQTYRLTNTPVSIPAIHAAHDM
ncbi:MAG TPA: EAL domain-containing protein [Pyrinomonadaceae bacterium]|nr:EAL domain-containing protein [Pyrinomonadaceae bacterium]